MKWYQNQKSYRPMIRFWVKLIIKKYKNLINKQVQKYRCRSKVRSKSDRLKKNFWSNRFFFVHMCLRAKFLLRAIWHIPSLSLMKKKHNKLSVPTSVLAKYLLKKVTYPEIFLVIYTKSLYKISFLKKYFFFLTL